MAEALFLIFEVPMYHAAHLIIVVLYLAAPLAVFGWGMHRAIRYNRKRPLRRLRSAVLAAVVIGIFVCTTTTIVSRGRLLPTQLVVTTYLATSFILLLQGADSALWAIAQWVLRLKSHKGSVGWYNTRAVTALVVRATLMVGVGLPYILAVVATYRTKAGETQTPMTLANWKYETVSFKATDGTRLSGWWIPAPHGVSTKTVILCPGWSGDKSTHLSLVKQLVPDDYNVLVFDFRAQGESDGQLCSFGDLERNDVLGAVRWLRTNKPAACERVVGLGVGTGAAALLSATADPSAEWQTIDAVAVYESYDRLPDVVDAVASEILPEPLASLTAKIGLPLAGLQVGADLSEFSPATSAAATSPRPVLVIHGMSDRIFPFESGRALYQSAAEPKMNLWLEQCDYNQALANESAAKLVKRCFDLAGRVI
jgi:fermentation-respiration switch protein FrsA (DUF1100 family)